MVACNDAERVLASIVSLSEMVLKALLQDSDTTIFDGYSRTREWREKTKQQSVKMQLHLHLHLPRRETLQRPYGLCCAAQGSAAVQAGRLHISRVSGSDQLKGLSSFSVGPMLYGHSAIRKPSESSAGLIVVQLAPKQRVFVLKELTCFEFRKGVCG